MTDFTRKHELATGTALAVSLASSELLAQRSYDPGASLADATDTAHEPLEVFRIRSEIYFLRPY